MISIETEIKLANIFLALAEGEKSIDINRQILIELEDFDPYQVFTYLDIEQKNHINIPDFQNYFQENEINVNKEEIELIILFYDKDYDGVLSYAEFVNFLQSEYSKKRKFLNNSKSKNINISSLPHDVEQCLKHLLINEIELSKKIIGLLDELKKRYDFNIHDLYHVVKSWNYIEENSLRNFFERNQVSYLESDIRKIIKRLDFNGDGKIDFSEFHAFLGFPNCQLCCTKESCKFCGLCCCDNCINDAPCSIHKCIHFNNYKENDNQDKNIENNNQEKMKENNNFNNMKIVNEERITFNKIKNAPKAQIPNKRVKTRSINNNYGNDNINSIEHLKNENGKNRKNNSENKQKQNNKKDNMKYFNGECLGNYKERNRFKEPELSNSYIGKVSDNLNLRISPQRKYSPKLFHSNSYYYKPETYENFFQNEKSLIYDNNNILCQLCHNFPCCCCSLCHLFPCKCFQICNSPKSICSPNCNNYPPNYCTNFNYLNCSCCNICGYNPCKCYDMNFNCNHICENILYQENYRNYSMCCPNCFLNHCKSSETFNKHNNNKITNINNNNYIPYYTNSPSSHLPINKNRGNMSPNNNNELNNNKSSKYPNLNVNKEQNYNINIYSQTQKYNNNRIIQNNKNNFYNTCPIYPINRISPLNNQLLNLNEKNLQDENINNLSSNKDNNLNQNINNKRINDLIINNNINKSTNNSQNNIPNIPSQDYGDKNSGTFPNNNYDQNNNNNIESNQGIINTNQNDENQNSRNKYTLSSFPYKKELLQFIDFLSYLMEIETKIEEKKIELAQKEDFNFEDIFRIFEIDGKAYIDPEDLKQGLKLLGLNPTDFDIRLLIKRFDLNKQGLLSYTDFFDMVVSFEKKMRNSVQIRPPNSCYPAKNPEIFEYETLIAIKTLFKYFIECENNINQKRINLDSLRNNFSQVIQFLDESRKGFINKNDLNLILTQFNKFTNLKECDLLFIRLDKNRKGKVPFDAIENELNFLK